MIAQDTLHCRSGDHGMSCIRLTLNHNNYSYHKHRIRDLTRPRSVIIIQYMLQLAPDGVNPNNPIVRLN